MARNSAEPFSNKPQRRSRASILFILVVIALAIGIGVWRGSCSGKVSRGLSGKVYRGLSGKVVGKHTEFARGGYRSVVPRMLYIVDVEEAPGKITTLRVSSQEFERLPLHADVVKEPGLFSPLICPGMEELSGRASQQRVKAFAEVTDPAQITKAALTNPDPNVRKAAIARISDRDVILRIARTDTEPDVRAVAVARVDDRAALIELAIDGPAAVFEAVVQKLQGDQEAMFELAMAGTRPVVSKISDRELLNRLVQESRSSYVQIDAAKQLGLRWDVRRIRERSAPRQPATSPSRALMPGVNVALVRSQDTLAEIAVSDPDFNNRRRALAMLDKARTTELARSAQDPALRLAASVRSGQRTWTQLLDAAEQDPALRGDVLCGLALDDIYAGVGPKVESLYLWYIRRGDRKRVPEFRQLLQAYGTVKMALMSKVCDYGELQEDADWCMIANGYIFTSNGWTRNQPQPATAPTTQAMPGQLNLAAMVQPASVDARVADPDGQIWSASAIKGADGRYHLYFSRCRRDAGYSARWTQAQIAHAVSDTPAGPYQVVDVALDGRDGSFWDGHCVSDPSVVTKDGRYYLYYVGSRRGDPHYNAGEGPPRIGLAVANSPGGPWKRFDKPILDVGEEKALDGYGVNYPKAAIRPDGSVLVIYKALFRSGRSWDSSGYRAAIASDPEGLYTKLDRPVLEMKDVGDGLVMIDQVSLWYSHRYGDRYYAVVQDHRGQLAGARMGIALFESADGLDWKPAACPAVLGNKVLYSSGTLSETSLEWPTILLDDDVPMTLFGEIGRRGSGPENSMEAIIPLKSR